jgi:hypothetical protein
MVLILHCTLCRPPTNILAEELACSIHLSDKVPPISSGKPPFYFWKALNTCLLLVLMEHWRGMHMCHSRVTSEA